MNQKLLVMVAVVALAGCTSSNRRCAKPDAASVVASFQPKQQFSTMLESIAERTQTAAMAENRDGASARKNLSRAIESTVERHAAEWERNMVSGWETLTTEESKQVCTALSERDRATFERFAARVGPEVKSRNEPLLKRAGAEVLEQIWSKEE